MKISKSLYTVLQYISTIDDIFVYAGNGYLIAKEKAGSGFVEVKAPDGFFTEAFVLRSLSKFLRLFTFDRKSKEADPTTIQEWTFQPRYDPATGVSISEIHITSPGRSIKLTQATKEFLNKRAADLVSKVDGIVLDDAIKFQIDSALYKQIMSDCSLLDLDRITIASENDETIRILLSKTGKGSNYDTSSYTVECHHQHNTNKITFLLSAFSLIDATDHQLEYGIFTAKNGNKVNILKVKSFCDNNMVVNKVILSDKGE